MRYLISVDKQTFEIEINRNGQVWVNGHPVEVDIQGIRDPTLYSLLVKNRSYETYMQLEGCDGHHLFIAGRLYKTYLLNKQTNYVENIKRVQKRRPIEITTPLPGRLSEIRVSDRQRVKSGDVVAILESMKMIVKLRTPCSGVVHLVDTNVCRDVSQGEILALIH